MLTKIKHLPRYSIIYDTDELMNEVIDHISELQEKVNEIIEVINKLEKKGKK